MRKKACIVKRGNAWAVKQPLPDGRYRWQTVGPRKRDAELLRDEINRRVALGALYPSNPQTFAEFVEGWLERYGQRVRPATLASCRDSLKRLAVFDPWQLETSGQPTSRITSSRSRGGRRASAELMLDTLKMILRSAQSAASGRRGDLPCRPPRRERAEMRFLDWPEVERLRRRPIEPYGNLVRFACLTGLRQGELFALRDRAVDLDARVCSWRRERGRADRPNQDERRSTHGQSLRRGSRILREQLLARAPNELGLVFPTPAGAVWRKDNFMARIFRPAVRRAELEPLRFHDLRHTYAALWSPPAPTPSSSRRSSATPRSTSP